MAEFRSLAELLRASRAEPPAVAAPAPSAVTEAPTLAGCTHVRELSLMHAAALEAFDAARKRVLQGFADEVLARELALGAADIGELTRRALERFARYEPVALVVSPSDAALVSAPLPVRIDPALHGGDLIVEVRDGALESRLAFRAGHVVANAG